METLLATQSFALAALKESMNSVSGFCARVGSGMVL
ncbi:MAG: hypothetical protein, partial [Olavius algarvensis Gamma 1 endosymbiont]